MYQVLVVNYKAGRVVYNMFGECWFRNHSFYSKITLTELPQVQVTSVT